MMTPSRSMRRYQLSSGSRIIGNSRSSSAKASIRSVTIYWCSIGTTGKSTPIMSPISRHQVPAALTMCSATISPLSVMTRHSPPRVVSIRGHLRMAINLRTAVARTPRHRMGRLAGVDMAVQRFVDRADQIVDLGQRINLPQFRRSPEFRKSKPAKRPMPLTWRNSSSRSRLAGHAQGAAGMEADRLASVLVPADADRDRRCARAAS